MTASGARPELYRRNVGLMLIAPDRRIFVGRRARQPNGQPEAWQMPQGGVDDDETPVEAAC
ncbi:MAG TPA: NUDIX domain-containing protein, partial [Reyranella sp.]